MINCHVISTIAISKCMSRSYKTVNWGDCTSFSVIRMFEEILELCELAAMARLLYGL